MPVQVVPVVMRVRVLVRHRLMVMPVGVRLHEVQRDAGHHQDTGQHQAPTARPVPEDPRQGRAKAAPTKGAKAYTDPVRAAPNERWANR